MIRIRIFWEKIWRKYFRWHVYIFLTNLVGTQNCSSIYSVRNQTENLASIQYSSPIYSVRNKTENFVGAQYSSPIYSVRNQTKNLSAKIFPKYSSLNNMHKVIQLRNVLLDTIIIICWTRKAIHGTFRTIKVHWTFRIVIINHYLMNTSAYYWETKSIKVHMLYVLFCYTF